MPHQPWEGDADPPLWTGPRAPPVLGGDADPPLSTGPQAPPALGGDAGAALSHQALGQPHRRGSPGPHKPLTGCFSSCSLWSGCRPPSGPQPGAWRLGRGGQGRPPAAAPGATEPPGAAPPQHSVRCTSPLPAPWWAGGRAAGPAIRGGRWGEVRSWGPAAPLPSAEPGWWARAFSCSPLSLLSDLCLPLGTVSSKPPRSPPAPVLLAGFCFSAFRLLPQQLG